MDQLLIDLAEVANKHGLDTRFGVSDKVIATYLSMSLADTLKLVSVARNQARIDALVEAQNAADQTVDGVGNLRLTFDNGEQGRSEKD